MRSIKARVKGHKPELVLGKWEVMGNKRICYEIISTYLAANDSVLSIVCFSEHGMTQGRLRNVVSQTRPH